VRRREFITLLGSAAAWPIAARAQQQPMPVVGFLGSRSQEDSANLVSEFRADLGETGFAEDRNVTIEFRWADGHYDRLPKLSADLVANQVAVICTWGLPGALAAKASTTKMRSSLK
jgi:putative ABC transport system substrate-binding protein